MSGNSYSLIETMAYQFINKIKNDPERNIRNSVDMALNFSNGRFQREFLNSAQNILKNEHSAYYGLIWDAVNNIDTKKLVTFGMNIGYNSCTKGAEIIRRLENQRGFSIPWSLTLKTNEEAFRKNNENYTKLIAEGKKLGIFTWFIHTEGNIQYLNDIVAENPDCAFVIFGVPYDINSIFTEEIANLNNVMLCIRYTKYAAEICERMRHRKMLYSIYFNYNENNTAEILDDHLLERVEYLHPVFTVLVPEQECSEMARNAVCKYVRNSRIKQEYGTILWENFCDSLFIDKVISGAPCSAEIDTNGNLYKSSTYSSDSVNCFSQGLENSFRTLFSK